MELSKELIQKMKDALEKDKGREFTWEEASEAANNLANLAELLLELYIKEKKRKERRN